MRSLPLIFACSGCSNAGRMADDVARELTAGGVAEMSCLAGIGARHPLFLKKLKGRDVWVIDGCPIECARGVFSQAQLKIDRCVNLQHLGVRKHDPLAEGQDRAKLIAAVRDRLESTREHMPGPTAVGPANRGT